MSYRGICRPGLEGFMNLQGLLVQSSNWFGISSVQFSSLGTSLESLFSSIWGTWVKYLRSVCSAQFIPFSSRTLPALTRNDPAVPAPLKISSIQQVSNCLGGAEEQFWIPSSGNPSPPARSLWAGWRNGALCWLCLLACQCPGCGVVSE